MWPSRRHQRERLADALRQHNAQVRRLRGLADPRALDVLTLQFVASLRREDYYKLVQRKLIAPRRADPNDPSFDPERAVAYHLQQGNSDEASWLLFLMTHFARPADSGWLRLRDVYGRLGAGRWDWVSVSRDPTAFQNWLDENWRAVRGKFGNHRKYESLRPDSRRSTGRVVFNYVTMIGDKGHRQFFGETIRQAGNDPHVIFDALYQRIQIASFGRLAKFDFLALLGRYEIAPICAGSAYLKGATGPFAGARLLFDGQPSGRSSERDLQRWLDELDADLNVGMQVMEDALCNWQKSPVRFIHYRG